MFIPKSIKTQLIIYLICFALFLAVKDQDWRFLFVILIAVISAVAIEACLSYFKTKILQISESAIITGLIIGFVLSSDGQWWKFMLASFVAIISKYLIGFKKKHIFNPAAFGIFFTIIFLGAFTQWRGTYAWYILIPFGFYFAFKLKKIEVAIGYIIVSLVLFVAQAFLQKIHLGNIFGYFSYFYIFVMVVEPKTTPLKPLGKYIFGGAVAVLIFVLTETGVGFDVELLSLLAINVTVPLLNKLS
ncbi:MAG: RnfABCDGE type electron transport complex subunit D [Lutibacter sp.]|jgi:Na+-translocating ferredoxin:NAD+ oxidoreductase RnfD subunit